MGVGSRSMAKLIIINGPCGSGKSTLAEKYADNNPLTLRLDIDEVRRLLSSWRERDDESAAASQMISLEMARVNLALGHDVVVAQQFHMPGLLDKFKSLSQDLSVEYYEILLDLDEDEAIRRFVLRGQSQGYEDGFKPFGLITKNGKEKALAEMHSKTVGIAVDRSGTIRIDPILGDIDQTYALLVEAVSA
jgi:predicted kinase